MRLLVVEDGDLLRTVLVNHAKRLEFTPVEAGDGLKGQQQLECDPSIVAVICDVNMPNMTGLEMYAAVRELVQARRIVFVFWANPKGEEQERAMIATGCHCFGKEVDVAVVLGHVRQALSATPP